MVLYPERFTGKEVCRPEQIINLLATTLPHNPVAGKKECVSNRYIFSANKNPALYNRTGVS
jgi:hypothetical protein